MRLRASSLRRAAGVRRLACAVCLLAMCGGAPAGAQRAAAPSEPPPPALEAMADAERAFAQRALAVGWKEAFLEYFSDAAIGYNGEEVGLAKEQIRVNPDPPKDHQLLWEPRYGDVARSGELGYLTGPSRNILPSRNNGQPRHGVYASVWKRERDGTFRVVMDVGVTTPRAASFRGRPDPGAVGEPVRRRLERPHAAARRRRQRAEQRSADQLRAGVSRSPGAGRALPSARSRCRWSARQRCCVFSRRSRAYDQIDSRFAESAQSGDLGYTWGTWNRRLPPARGRAGAPGEYGRRPGRASKRDCMPGCGYATGPVNGKLRSTC